MRPTSFPPRPLMMDSSRGSIRVALAGGPRTASQIAWRLKADKEEVEARLKKMEASGEVRWVGVRFNRWGTPGDLFELVEPDDPGRG